MRQDPTAPWTQNRKAIEAMLVNLKQLNSLLLEECVLRFKPLHPDAKLPAKSGKDEACYDICCVADDDFTTVDVGPAAKENGKVVWHTLTNPWLTAEASYSWVDRIIVIDERRNREVVFDGVKSKFDFTNWYEVTKPHLIMRPGDTHNFRTGLACDIPAPRAMFLWDRSGMGAKKNIHRLAGVIDCTYRGEWIVCLTHLGKNTHVIYPGDKIVQGELALVLPSKAEWAEELSETYRGEDGFGSTGR